MSSGFVVFIVLLKNIMKSFKYATDRQTFVTEVAAHEAFFPRDI